MIIALKWAGMCDGARVLVQAEEVSDSGVDVILFAFRQMPHPGFKVTFV